MAKRTILKKTLITLAFVILVLTIIYYWELINYGLAQAKGQLKVIREAELIENVLADTAVADSVKQKIRLIQEVRSFAVSELGLKETENYTSFYDQQGKDILWNLSACEPYSFTPKKVAFPIARLIPIQRIF